MRMQRNANRSGLQATSGWRASNAKIGTFRWAAFAAVVALVALAAATPPKVSEIFIVPLTSINEGSIDVSPVGKREGQLTFGVRLENERELEDLVSKKKAFLVRIMEGHSVITEARLVAIHKDEHGRIVRLGLGFASLEEARKAATNLRRH